METIFKYICKYIFMHFHAAYYFLFLDNDCGCNVHLVESFYEMGYPLVMTNSMLLKMAIEIVSFPIKKGGSFHSYVNVYQS